MGCASFNELATETSTSVELNRSLMTKLELDEESISMTSYNLFIYYDYYFAGVLYRLEKYVSFLYRVKCEKMEMVRL